MTAAEIAEILGLALSTVSLWLRRIGLGKRSRLGAVRAAQPLRAPPSRASSCTSTSSSSGGSPRAVPATACSGTEKASQAAATVRKAAALTGHEYVHVMVDDHSRLAYAEVLEGLTAGCAVAFLRRAVAWFAERRRHDPGGDDRQRLLLRRLHATGQRCAELGLRHLRIRPGRPRTNGKAERLIQTLLERVGLRPHLRQLSRAHSGVAALPRALQLQTSTRLPRQASSGHEGESLGGNTASRLRRALARGRRAGRDRAARPR